MKRQELEDPATGDTTVLQEKTIGSYLLGNQRGCKGSSGDYFVETATLLFHNTRVTVTSQNIVADF
jgi:hypothetical protein